MAGSGAPSDAPFNGTYMLGHSILDVGPHGVGIGQLENPLPWTLAWTATPSRYAVTSISSIGRASAACPYTML